MAIVPHQIYRFDERNGSRAYDHVDPTRYAEMAGNLTYEDHGVEYTYFRGLSFPNTAYNNGQYRIKLAVNANAFTGSITVCGWAKPSSVSTDDSAVAHRIWSKNDGASGRIAIGFNNSHLAFGARHTSSGGSYTKYEGATSISVDTLYHWALTYNTSGHVVNCYLNGALEIGPTSIGGPIDFTYVNSLPMIVGCNPLNTTQTDSSHFNRYYMGELADLMLFTGEATAQEIADIYNLQKAFYCGPLSGMYEAAWIGTPSILDHDADVQITVNGSSRVSDSAFNLLPNYANTTTSCLFSHDLEITTTDTSNGTANAVIEATVKPAVGSSQTVTGLRILPPDSEGGTVPQSGAHQHCYPPNILVRDNGQLDLWSARVSLSGKIFLYKNGINQGEIFADIPNSEREQFDLYHTNCVFTHVQGGIAAIAGYHNYPRWCAWASTPGGLTGATAFKASVDVGGAPNSTSNARDYCYLVPGEASNELLYLSRVYTYGTVVTRVTDPAGTPSIDEDHLMYDSVSQYRAYPRNVYKFRDVDDNRMYAYAFHGRINNTFQWGGCPVLIQDASRQTYNAQGQAIGNTTAGTIGSPRFSVAQMFTNAYGSTGFNLLPFASAGYMQYLSPNVLIRPRPDGWDASGNKGVDVLMLYTENGPTAVYPDSKGTNVQARLSFHDGQTGTIYTTPADANVFGLDRAATFRLTGYMWWKNGNPKSGFAQILVGLPEPGATVLPTGNDYHCFGTGNATSRDLAGAGRFRMFEVDLTAIGSGSDLADAVVYVKSIPSETVWFANLQPVGGCDSMVVVDSASDYVHTSLPSARFIPHDLTGNLLLQAG